MVKISAEFWPYVDYKNGTKYLMIPYSFIVGLILVAVLIGWLVA